MDQETRWLTRFNEVKAFVEKNKRNPSKYCPEEKLKFHWIHQNKKRLNAGSLKPERVEMFKKLLALCEQYRHKNQYE